MSTRRTVTAVTIALLTAIAVPAAPVGAATGVTGYWLASAAGEVFSFGSAADHGHLTGNFGSATTVAVVATPADAGYWLVLSDGHVAPFGDATGYGGPTEPSGVTVTGLAPTPDGHGYWLVDSTGNVSAFGDGVEQGSAGIGSGSSVRMVGITATPGNGYWLVASDGGVFPFGDAKSFGSLSGQALSAPVVGMAAMPTGDGYWLVTSDGGVFPFGSAVGHGSLSGQTLSAPIVGIAPTASGNGYWLVAGDGGTFPFGDAQQLGSAVGKSSSPVIGIAVQPVAPRAVITAATATTLSAKTSFAGSKSTDGVQITRYDWSFGDGEVARGATVTHAFTTAGARVVSLTITDVKGATSTARLTVHVRPTLHGPQVVANGKTAALTGLANAGSRVTLYAAQVGHSLAAVATSTATSSGNYRFSRTVTTTNVYSVADNGERAAQIVVGSNPTLRGPTKTRLGSTVSFSGVAVPGTKVTIYATVPGQSFRRVGQAVVNTKATVVGDYFFSAPITHPVEWFRTTAYGLTSKTWVVKAA